MYIFNTIIFWKLKFVLVYKLEVISHVNMDLAYNHFLPSNFRLITALSFNILFKLN